MSLSQAANLLLNAFSFFVERFNLPQNHALSVGLWGRTFEFVNTVLFCERLLLGIHVDPTSIISLYIHVVNPVLELLGCFFSMVVHRLLNLVPVDLPDCFPHTLAVFLVHHAQEIFFSHGISLNFVERLVQKFRALLIKKRVIINDDAGMQLLFHDDLRAEEFLIEQPVTDTHDALCHKNGFKDLLILVLNDLVFLEVSGLQDLNKVTNESSNAISFKSLG